MTTYEILSTITALGSAIAAGGAIVLSFKVHRSDRLLSQRQLLLPLWQYMSTLNRIDSSNPVTADVIKSANTLELVALCCESGMIDPRVVKRTFSETFMSQFESIKRCNTLPGTNMSGDAVLHECRAASKFYTELKQEHDSRGQPTSGG